MYAELNVLVVILGAVLAVSIVCHAVALRRVNRLSAMLCDHDGAETVALQTAIAQMLEQVTQLSAAVDRKLSQLPRPDQPARPSQRQQAAGRSGDDVLYGPSGMPVERVIAQAAIRTQERTALDSTLESLLEASDRVVDKLELARQAGIGVGEVELWLRRHSQRPVPVSQTPAGAGV